MICCRSVKKNSDVTSISSNDQTSDIIIDDPRILYPPGLNYENRNRTTRHSYVNPGSQIPTSPSKWKRGRFLGQGAFGQVYVGFNSDSGQMCAMKEVILCPEDPKSRESVKQLRRIGDKFIIFLEYVAGGSIYKLLQQYGPFDEPIVRNYTRQILDIKGANILVDPSGIVKLADFGVAKDISGDSCPLSLKGSPYWMAPEVIKNSNGCNPAVDIWSLGCTVIEMATTKPPWSQYEWAAAMFKIWSTEELPAMPDELSAEGKDFVQHCLQRNPMHRPSAAQLLQHPFVKDAKQPLPIHQVYAENVNPCFLGPEAAHSYLTRSYRISSGSSNPYSPSCPVSPTMRSQLPLSGNNAVSFHKTRHQTLKDEALGAIPRPKIVMSGRMSPTPISSPATPSGGGSSSVSPRTPGSSYAYRGTFPFNNDGVLGYHYRQTNMEGGSPSKLHLPEHVPQLEIADKSKTDLILDINSSAGLKTVNVL
ncbi:hypothetical protein RIF29_39917 [Crotalaria pallida]|uniref:mitogen-activated protein kinase kinase kinase n=1 Tax=Crotalaria pallida TaxID=3830 RepID=A0AAN9HQ24_CROPI